jgi:hypothetical protein
MYKCYVIFICHYKRYFKIKYVIYETYNIIFFKFKFKKYWNYVNDIIIKLYTHFFNFIMFIKLYCE